MKRLLISASFTIALLFPGIAQTPPDEQQRMLALIREVQTQEAQIAEKQEKITSQLAAVAENIRQARIYSGRSN
jgi:cell division protein FtsL